MGSEALMRARGWQMRADRRRQMHALDGWLAEEEAKARERAERLERGAEEERQTRSRS